MLIREDKRAFISEFISAIIHKAQDIVNTERLEINELIDEAIHNISNQDISLLSVIETPVSIWRLNDYLHYIMFMVLCPI